MKVEWTESVPEVSGWYWVKYNSQDDPKHPDNRIIITF